MLAPWTSKMATGTFNIFLSVSAPTRKLFPRGVKTKNFRLPFYDVAVLAQSVERVHCRAGSRGFDSRGRTNTQGLKITEK